MLDAFLIRDIIGMVEAAPGANYFALIRADTSAVLALYATQETTADNTLSFIAFGAGFVYAMADFMAIQEAGNYSMILPQPIEWLNTVLPA